MAANPRRWFSRGLCSSSTRCPGTSPAGLSSGDAWADRSIEPDGTLLAHASGYPAFALHAAGDDWYALGDVDTSLHMLREDGRIVALELAQNGTMQRA